MKKMLCTLSAAALLTVFAAGCCCWRNCCHFCGKPKVCRCTDKRAEHGADKCPPPPCPVKAAETK